MNAGRLKNVLIIDDAKFVQQFAGNFFRKLKFNILVAANGYDGLKIALASKPDLILLDLLMPRLDGLKTLQVMKSNELTKNIPVIVVTAHSDRINILSAGKLGAAAVVTKPLSEEVLLEKVRKIFGDKFIREMIPNDHSGAANPFGVNEEEYSEALRPMVEEFLKYFSELVDELSMAVRDRDVESIKRITHDIKGTSGSFGYDDATALAVKLCEAVSPDSSSTVAFADWNKSEDLLLQLRNKVKS